MTVLAVRPASRPGACRPGWLPIQAAWSGCLPSHAMPHGQWHGVAWSAAVFCVVAVASTQRMHAQAARNAVHLQACVTCGTGDMHAGACMHACACAIAHCRCEASAGHFIACTLGAWGSQQAHKCDTRRNCRRSMLQVCSPRVDLKLAKYLEILVVVVKLIGAVLFIGHRESGSADLSTGAFAPGARRNNERRQNAGAPSTSALYGQPHSRIPSGAAACCNPRSTERPGEPGGAGCRRISAAGNLTLCRQAGSRGRRSRGRRACPRHAGKAGRRKG
eukprot:364618-Chlamydomonas_euryale.AAC.3